MTLRPKLVGVLSNDLVVGLNSQRRLLLVLMTYTVSLLYAAAFQRDTWLATALSAPLFYMLPLGFGWLLINPARISSYARIGTSTLLVIAIAIGFVVITWLVQIASALNLISPSIIFLVLWLVALFGLTQLGRFIQARRVPSSKLFTIAFLFLFASASTWWFHFAAFSDYPFTDLFAETHIMKAAWDFSQNALLNPYSSLAYVPLRPALLGGLKAAFGLDLLKSYWFLHFLTPALYLVGVFSAFRNMPMHQGCRALALTFAAGAIPFTLATNGSLAAISSLAIISLLFSPYATLPTSFPTAGAGYRLIFVCSASLGAFGPTLINNDGIASSALLGLLLIWASISRASMLARSFPQMPVFGLLFVTAFTTALLHRGGLLYVVAIVGCWLIFELFQVATRIRSTAYVGYLVWLLSAILPAIILSIAVIILAIKFGIVSSPFDSVDFFSSITQLILGRSINRSDELALGLGGDIALVEMVRWLGPLFTVFAGAVACTWLVLNPPHVISLRLAATTRPAEWITPIWAWIAGLTLVGAILSGFPFVYRSGYLAILLLSVAVAGMWFDLFSGRLFRNERPQALMPPWAYVVACAICIAFLALAGAAYGLVPRVGAPYSGFQALFRPTLISACFVILFLLWALHNCKTDNARYAYLLSLLIIVLSADRAAITVRLQPFSYGPMPQAPKAISHYSANDLSVVEWMRQNTPKALLISDPYTLAFAKAFTGNPSLYLYSNLDTVQPGTSISVKSVLKGVLNPALGQGAAFCAYLGGLLRNLNQEAQMQLTPSEGQEVFAGLVRAKVSKVDQSFVAPAPFELPSDALPPSWTDESAASSVENSWNFLSPHIRAAFSQDGGWKIVAIINPRTLEWIDFPTDRRLGYFPPERTLPIDVVRAPFRAPFDRKANIDDRTLVVEIKCLK
jgi:hypothetical protein